MVDIDVTYLGELRCRSVHRPSGSELLTDAPVDNHGRGESFSPTDLVATGLGTCMITVMGIRARELGVNLDGARVHIRKHMQSAPRRIARLEVILSVPRARAAVISPEQRAELEQRADTCPVRLSLLEAIEVPVAYDWDAD